MTLTKLTSLALCTALTGAIVAWAAPGPSSTGTQAANTNPARSAPPAQGNVAPARVGVLNAMRIFNRMKEHDDLKAKIEQRIRDSTNQGNNRKTAIDQMKQARDSQLKPGSAQYKEATANLDKAMADYQSWGQMTQMQIARDEKDMIRTLFDRIQAASAEIAKQEGYDLILADQAPEIGPDLDTVPVEKLSDALQRRQILFVSPKIDITEKVLVYLDAQFSKK